MAAVINFLSVDAQLPLVEGGEVNFKASEGFKKAPAVLEPKFDGAVTAYEVVCPKGTTHVSIGATSFTASVTINGVPGNMSSVDVRNDVSSISIVLEKPAGTVVNQYTLTPKISDLDAETSEVKFEKAPVPAADAAPHTHSHGGVPCTADHSGDETHGHSHDGGKTQCTEDHGHGHGHGEKKSEEHGHSHDGGKTQCTEDHGHGHGEKKEEHGHGHGHGDEKEEKHSHSHDGGKTECTEDHGHGHGHGEQKEEKHGHGHGHSH